MAVEARTERPRFFWQLDCEKLQPGLCKGVPAAIKPTTPAFMVHLEAKIATGT